MKKKILIIDDESDLCDLIRHVLLKEHYLVECAYSLADARDKLRNHPSIVLLDNNLPDGSGLDYIQMHPQDFLNTYVVMISADASQELKTRATREGIDAFLPKPFSMGLMKEIIRKAA